MVRRSDDQQGERRVERRTERRGEHRSDERRTDKRRTEHANSADVKSTSRTASLLAIRYSIPIEYRVACYFSFPLVLGLGLITLFATK